MPTARGWTVLAASAAFLALGLAVGYRELAAVGSVGIVTVVLAACWVGLPPRYAVDRTITPPRLSRGERCQAVIDLHSASRGSRVLTIADRIRGPGGDRVVPVSPVRVRGGMPARTGYDVPTDRRGLLTVGPLWVGRRDMLGLCGTNRAVGETARLLVRPRWRLLRGVPLGASPSLDGATDGALHGSIAFHALREYQLGDDFRHVHWRTSARVGTLMVREHIDTARPRLVLLLDDRGESYRGDAVAVEEAVEAAASVLVTAGQNGLPVMLCLVSGARSADPAGAGLDLLAQVQPCDGLDLVAAMHGLRVENTGDTLVMVTGPGADLAPVTAARTSYARVVVVVLGGVATTAAPLAGVTLIAATTAVEFADRWNGMSAWT